HLSCALCSVSMVTRQMATVATSVCATQHHLFAPHKRAECFVHMDTRPMWMVVNFVNATTAHQSCAPCSVNTDMNKTTMDVIRAFAMNKLRFTKESALYLLQEVWVFVARCASMTVAVATTRNAVVTDADMYASML
ncbi:hypothetical protein, partial [Salmonella sp. s51884]|uniref:hypothetical protein n=1 Tax=Salmonella sp. s51884 TaxID=3159654 RepID=UPI003980BE82